MSDDRPPDSLGNVTSDFPRNTDSAAGASWPTMYDGQRRELRDLIVHGGRSRVELARRHAVSRASLSRITRELIDLGLVAEGAVQHSATRGRPSELVHVRLGAAHF